MEYEQVERGRRIVMDAIASQDINGYYDLLSPDVLLVTHFPYPSTIADCNVQAVRRWIEKPTHNHCAAAPAAGGGTANNSVAGSRGYATASLNAATKTTATSPVALAGVGGARSQRKRLRELLRRQAQWRSTGQQRYETYRKRRERNHRCATGEVVEDDDATGTDGVLKSGNVDARGDQATSQKDAGADGHKRRGLVDKSGSKDSRVRSEASAAAARAEDGIRWFQQQQSQEPQQPGVRLQQPWPGEAQAALRSARPSAGAQRTQPAAGHVVSYEDAVSITEGQLLVSCRFFELLHWVASSARKSGPTGKMLPVEVDLQLRKDILQEEEVLAPPEDPRTPQETFSQLGRQFTERNQPLSCMRVIWGAENILFEDKIFFDDGFVVTIHRRMLTVVEVLSRWTPAVPPSSQATHDNMSPVQISSPQSPPQQLRLSDKGGRSALSPRRKGAGFGNARGAAAGRPEQVYQAVEVFYKPTDSRIDTHNIVWPLLDFSFVEAPQPVALLRSTPVSGHVHVNQKPRLLLDPHAVQGVFLNQDNDLSKPEKQSSNRTLIKARNKLGEEEAYEFQVQKRRFSAQDDDGTGSGDGDDLGANCTTGARPRNGNGASGGLSLVRYDASCVRVSGCHLEERMDQLVPVLRRLVANCLLTLHTLDLSQNGISSLTDLRLLPLRNLRLHGNAIADWRVVESCIAPLPYLSILTLHGNPIAEDMSLEDNVGASDKAAVPDAHRARIDEGASSGGRVVSESRYWRRLLSLLLGNPARVVPLRQVDFVTLTGLEYNIAGAYEMFTTGRTGVLAAARSMTRADGRCSHKVR